MSRIALVKPQLATVRPALAPPPKLADAIYRDPRWLSLMRDLKASRGRRCEECGHGHRVILGDHIVELKDGGAPFDPKNVKLMCLPCHNVKTAKARSARQGWAGSSA